MTLLYHSCCAGCAAFIWALEMESEMKYRMGCVPVCNKWDVPVILCKGVVQQRGLDCTEGSSLGPVLTCPGSLLR